MKTVLWTDDLGIGGVAQYNHALLGALVRQGFQAISVSPHTQSPLVEEQAGWGVAHRWMAKGNEFEPDPDVPFATSLLQEIQPNLVLFSNCWPLSNLAAKRAACSLGFPFIIIEGFAAEYKDQSVLAGRTTELALHYAAARDVIAVSHENLRCLRRHYELSADQGQVIYYGRPDIFFQPPDAEIRRVLRREWSIPEDAVLCFTSARLEMIKGYHYQLSAIRHMKGLPVWQRLHFAWAGTGSLEGRLRESIRELGIADHVHLIGQVWNVAQWLDASDIFVLTSKAEGMPLAIMEAMAKGLAVTATAVSGIPEELGPTGKLLPPPTQDNLERMVRELIGTLETWAGNDPLRRFVGMACRERAAELFREDRMLDEMMGAVKKALAGQQPGEIQFPKADQPPIMRDLGIRRAQPGFPAVRWPPDFSQADRDIIDCVRPFTMTTLIRVAALIEATRYLVRNGIPGDFVECGVWRGGSIMAAALTLLAEKDTSRNLYLFDTFEGMPPPAPVDIRFDGLPAATELAQTPEGQGVWCRCGLDEVKANLAATGYPPEKLHFIQGKVEDTLPHLLPRRPLALVRLDTDWYESTRHELEQLFPLLVSRGILIIDDYGHWQGARKATDEFFAKSPDAVYLHRIDYGARIGVKM